MEFDDYEMRRRFIGMAFELLPEAKGATTKNSPKYGPLYNSILE